MQQVVHFQPEQCNQPRIVSQNTTSEQHTERRPFGSVLCIVKNGWRGGGGLVNLQSETIEKAIQLGYGWCITPGEGLMETRYQSIVRIITTQYFVMWGYSGHTLRSLASFLA